MGRVAGDGFQLLGDSTKNGTVFWVVVPAGAPKPVFHDVKSGHAAEGTRPIAAGDFYVSGGSAKFHGRASQNLTVGAASGFGVVYDLVGLLNSAVEFSLPIAVERRLVSNLEP